MKKQLASLRHWLDLADTAERLGFPGSLSAALHEISTRAGIAAIEAHQAGRTGIVPQEPATVELGRAA